MRKITLVGLCCAVLGSLALAAAPGALAKDGDVRVAGTCTKASTSKLKLSNENGRIEVEFEVDQNRVGRVWAVAVRRNGVVVSRQTKVTRAPSGSFTARLLLANRAGTDRISATAVARTGETCRAAASF